MNIRLNHYPPGDALSRTSTNLQFIYVRTLVLADIAQAAAIEEQIRAMEIQLAALRNQRDAHYLSLWDIVKRVYDGVKSIYGDDSSQYEMVGRKRASQRKPRSRKPVTP